MLRHLTQKLIRAMALKVSERVAKNELFEQAGERESSSPLRSKVKSQGNHSANNADDQQKEESVDDLFFFDSARHLKSTICAQNRLTIVHQWATWCEGCVSELAVVNDLALMLEEQVGFVALSWDLFQHGDRDRAMNDLQEAYDQNQLSFRTAIVEDEPEVFFEQFDISFQQIPQTWICSAEGAVLFRCEEELTIPKIEELLAALESLNQAN